MKRHTPPPKWTRPCAFVFAVVTACFAAPSAAMANETRISVGYRIVDLRTGHLGSSSDVDGNGYYIRAEGDEGEFLYGACLSADIASLEPAKFPQIRRRFRIPWNPI